MLLNNWCTDSGYAAGAQSARGWQHNTLTNPEPAPYQVSSFQSDLRTPTGAQNSPHGRELPTPRGRGPGPSNGALTPLPQSQFQTSARAPSPRVQLSNGDSATRPPLGTLDRRPSASYGHHRQTSIVHGVAQHSRNPSSTNSSNSTHRNPQCVANGTVPMLLDQEILSPNVKTIESSDIHLNTTLASAVNSSMQNAPANSTSPGDWNVIDAGNSALTQKRVDRMHSGKIRRDHSRSQSKHQPEQTAISEYALHHLFNSVSMQYYFSLILQKS